MINLFTQRLSELIKNSNKTQNIICKELNVTKQKLSKWKTGYNEPCLDELIMLAVYFKVSTDYLLGIVDDFGKDTIITNSFNNFHNMGNFNI